MSRATARAGSGVPLRDAACLVTGATGGIGSATARALAAAGARLVLHGRDHQALRALAAELRAASVQADLMDPSPVEAAESLAARAAAAVGPLEVVVATAGAGRAEPFVATAPADIEELLALDLLAPALLARAVLGGMAERRRGQFVFVASIAGHVGVRDEAAYCAAKGGLVNLGRALRLEMAQVGVGVSLVSPGAVATGFFARRGRPYDRRWPRPVRPEKVAAAILEAIERDRARVMVPSWMALPAAIAGVAPRAYDKLAARFG